MFPTLVLRKFAATCRNFTALGLLAVALLFLAAPRAEAQVTITPNVVISQIYTRGGEAGATYQSDYIEIFNRGTAPINLNNWAIQIGGLEGSPNSGAIISFVSSSGSITIEPGRYKLFELARGSAGQPLPSPDFPAFGSFAPNLGGASGFVALYRQAPNAQFGACPSGEFLVDMVGYGSSTCFEGSGPAPTPTTTTALIRDAQGCADTGSNASDFKTLAPNPRNSSTPAAPCNAPGGSSVIQLGVAQLSVAESDGKVTVPITRTGDTSAPASIEYIVAGGTASERNDYTTARGTLYFAPGEDVKTFDLLITNDALDEVDEETTGVLIFNVKGASLGSRTHAPIIIRDDDFGTPAANPIDDSMFLARQHYHDFLNREPDLAGLNFWTQNVESCGADAACRELKRIDTSAAFFLSIEFQRTGFFVHRLYRAAIPERQFRPRGLPRYHEFVRDSQAMSRGVVVGEAGWEQKIEANTVAFLQEFISRPEFLDLYPAQLAPAEFVARLNARAGGVLTLEEVAELSARMTAGLETRASVLRRVVEDEDLRVREKNPAFVLMQYFGYLRRNPDDAPDTDFSGYDFWLGKLNSHDGDYHRAEMVKSFLISAEYRERFVK